MSKQVLDIKQMMHLRELGLDTSSSSFRYERNKSVDKNGLLIDAKWRLKSNEEVYRSDFDCYDIVFAFTLQDILDLLPKEISIPIFQHSWFLVIDYQGLDVSYSWASKTDCMYNIKLISLKENELIDAAYEMLCWCIENGYIKTE